MGKEIYNIINDMAEVLNASQMQKLQEVLVNRLSENRVPDYLQTRNEEFLDMFLTAKHLEGCSDKTICYYRCNIQRMLETVDVPVIKISTEMLRKYLLEYQSINNCGKVTIDNVRRSLSTFFSWLEEEDYIIKSPMKRIHKVKTAVVVCILYTSEDADEEDSGDFGGSRATQKKEKERKRNKTSSIRMRKNTAEKQNRD